MAEKCGPGSGGKTGGEREEEEGANKGTVKRTAIEKKDEDRKRKAKNQP